MDIVKEIEDRMDRAVMDMWAALNDPANAELLREEKEVEWSGDIYPTYGNLKS